MNTKNIQDDFPIPPPPSNNAFDQKSVHRGLGDNATTSTEDQLITREAAEYIPEFKRYTQFFSTSPLNDLFDTWAVFAEKYCSNSEFSDSEYSVRLDLLTDDIKLEMMINILEVIGEEKYCIEVINCSGDFKTFNEVYKKLKLFFGGHLNSI